MGTAPPGKRQPAMPDPARTVTRSMAVLRRLGLDDEQAIGLIIIVASRVADIMTRSGNPDLDWPMHVIGHAIKRAAVLTPSHTDQQETDHGDGPGSSTGSTDQDPE